MAATAATLTTTTTPGVVVAGQAAAAAAAVVVGGRGGHSKVPPHNPTSLVLALLSVVLVATPTPPAIVALTLLAVRGSSSHSKTRISQWGCRDGETVPPPLHRGAVVPGHHLTLRWLARRRNQHPQLLRARVLLSPPRLPPSRRVVTREATTSSSSSSSSSNNSAGVIMTLRRKPNPWLPIAPTARMNLCLEPSIDPFAYLRTCRPRQLHLPAVGTARQEMREEAAAAAVVVAAALCHRHQAVPVPVSE